MTDTAQRLASALADRYQVDGEIGRGGMAVVYGARDLKHQRQVALKVLSADESAVRGTERFLREIRVAAGLSHPHILPVYDSGEVAGQLYFVMPLVEGESLRHRLSTDKQLPDGEALCIAREIADALAYAHGQGVVHRDVKPENILLSHGHALLADFGVARTSAPGPAGTLTATGVIVGTPDYMSPEQLLGEDSVGPASDVYALGCVLFEMLTGEPPYRGAHVQALLARRLSGPLPSVRAIRSDVTPSLDHAIGRALAAEPGERFATALDFSRALEETTRAIAPAARSEISLVVRPFDTVGDAADLGFFADGLTEEVIGGLSKVRTLRVISRTSAMRLKDSTLDARAIGRDYDVRYVVTGSVRSSGPRVRVATEIADAWLDAPVWSGRFDGSLDDPFAMQDQVAEGIVAALRVSLSPDDQRRLTERPIADVRAYNCHRMAMAEIVKFTLDGLKRAESLLTEALALVGDNARLFAAMGSLHWQYVNAGFDVREERLVEAQRWLERALALEPELAETHAVLAWMGASRGDMAGAMAHLDRALASEPNHAMALAFAAIGDWLTGRRDHMRETVDRLQSVDPSDLWGIVIKGVDCTLSGDRAGRDHYFRLAADVSDAPIVLAVSGVVQAQDGDLVAARATWASVKAAPSTSDMSVAICCAGTAALDGQADEVRAQLAPAPFQQLMQHDPQWAWHGASVYALAGLRDEALVTLELAVRQGFCNVWMLEERDATLASLRDDPRFAPLVATAREKAAAVEAALAKQE